MTWELVKLLLRKPAKHDPAQRLNKWIDAASVTVRVTAIVAAALNKDIDNVTLDTNTYDFGASVPLVRVGLKV